MKFPKNPNTNGKASQLPDEVSDVSLVPVDDKSVQRRSDNESVEAKQSTESSQEPQEPKKSSRRKRRLPSAYSRFDWRTFLKSRRLEMTALIISLLVSNFFVLHVWNFESRFDKARQSPPYLPLWEQLENAEYTLYDARFTNRGPRIPNSLNNIVIVGIDETSMRALGTWPFPRSYHAQLIRRLKKAGAKVIALDIGFHDRNNLADDADVAKAMDEAGNVILPSYDESEDGIVEGSAQTTAHLYQSPLTATDYDEWWKLASPEIRSDPKNQTNYKKFQELGLDEQTPDSAIVTLDQDLDSASRRYSFRVDYHDGTVHIGGFAVLAASVYEELLDGNKNEAYEVALKSGVMPTLHGKMEDVPLQYNQPPDAESPVHYTTPINFWGPSQTFSTYSYSNVLSHKIIGIDDKPLMRGYSDEMMRRLFKDKLVFVGATAHILKDRFPIPFFDKRLVHQNLDITKEINGVEIHASVAAMLLDGEYIYTVKPRTTILLVYLLSVAAGLWTAVLRGWVNKLSRVTQHRARKIGLRISLHALIWFALYGLLLVPPLFGFWGVCQWFFDTQNLWVIAVYPLGGAITSSVLVLLMLYGAESVERRKTIEQLGSYMAPEVRDEILAQAEGDYVRPRRVEATMLFTDLEGFTTYSEDHSPEEVVEALNDYFDRMVRIIRAHGGTTDKFIGDAVMAFFNVPVPRYDHTSQAVLCAIAMQEECVRFRQDTGIEFYMRIGIHTGEIIAGSIGAMEARFLSYTVIGDNVNLASRLEGKNKEFNSWIMCSSETFEAARELVEGESTRAQIKGKAKEVEVYIVHGLKGQDEQWRHWGHELPEPTKGALTDKDNIAFGEREAIGALPAPAEEVSEKKSS